MNVFESVKSKWASMIEFAMKMVFLLHLSSEDRKKSALTVKEENKTLRMDEFPDWFSKAWLFSMYEATWDIGNPVYCNWRPTLWEQN